MIRLTRLNNQPIVVNAEMVESLEATPDTVVSLANGQKLAVLETVDEVIAEIVHYQQKVREKPVTECPEECAGREAEPR